ASIRAGVGPFIGCGEVTMDMKRMKNSYGLRAAGVGLQFRLATGNDDPMGARSTRFLQKIGAVPEYRRCYCPRSMTRPSALSGTRRHCALSSASNCQVSPVFDIRMIWPRSSRHCVGPNAATAGSHFGLRNTWKLSEPASVLVSVKPQIGRPLPRTIDQSPIIWSIDLASERAAARFCRI